MSDDEGHKNTFHIPWVPWHKQTDEQKGVKMPAEWYGDWPESKAYLEEARGYLLQIMAERHKPKIVWELASKALRLLDMEEQDGQEN